MEAILSISETTNGLTLMLAGLKFFMKMALLFPMLTASCLLMGILIAILTVGNSSQTNSFMVNQFSILMMVSTVPLVQPSLTSTLTVSMTSQVEFLYQPSSAGLALGHSDVKLSGASVFGAINCMNHKLLSAIKARLRCF